MRNLLGFMLICSVLLIFSGVSSGASARCVVIANDGSKITIDCADRAKQFPKGTKIKIKTSKKNSG